MKKAIAIKLNDHYAKLTDGSSQSHHSPNDVIAFIKSQQMSMVRKHITIFDKRASQVEAY